MAQTYRYPAGATLTLAAQGTNGAANPASSLQVAGKSPSNTLVPLSVDVAGVLNVNVSTIPGNLTVDLNKVGGVAITLGQKVEAASIPVTLASDQALPLPTGAATETTLAAMSAKLPATLGQKAMAASMAVTLASDQSALAVTVASLPLPTGASTSALQTSGNTTLTSISGQLPATLGQKAMAASLAVTLASDQSALAVTVASLPLPSGAATSALQTTGNTSLSSIDGKLASLGQKAMTGSEPVVIASDQSAIPVTQSGTWTVQPGNTANTTPWLTQARINDGAGVSIGSNTVGTLNALNVSQIGRSASAKNRIDYSSTPVTTSAYTQVLASTAAIIREVEIFDSSGQSLVIAVGGAGSEVDQVYIFPGGNGRIPLNIAGGSRVSIKAVSANATSGESLINFYA